MTKFSPEELIRFLYKETSHAQTDEILASLEQDWTLREKLSVIKAAMHRLDGLVEAPRTEVILNVLRYAGDKSKNLQVKA